MSGYDNYILNGSWHKCVCGSSWSDSDGGPCHARCVECGTITDCDDIDFFGRCPKCYKTIRTEGV
jgi:hypothetical protein